MGVGRIRTDPQTRAFDLRSTDFRCCLVLPEAERRSVELEFDTDLDVGETDLKCLDLHTGRMRGVGGRVIGRRRIVLDLAAELSVPILLILGQAGLGGEG